jgi:hypothetical protein
MGRIRYASRRSGRHRLDMQVEPKPVQADSGSKLGFALRRSDDPAMAV